ncbi:RNA polymerase sigma factor SigJ [Streptomyces sp. WMMC500]|uniref:RNA polymerase sigma factor SigJ n=1 Tax=Streptomyces sp. WMMC500 TaxID=3015154 RepID=UPI00248CA46B|nr:RNA polymerase sigma factor SigJ [Streptomyces sp. WMMC500]WBB60869.1 RNA polymerase sigma factor SigJ [Streptomyces sp. WMMC500]
MAYGTEVDVFEEHRSVLMGVAYRMLGEFADAEDVVQDAWLRWSSADRDNVRDARGYLVRIVTHLSLDRLRQTQARREAYVGPWLPEPLATDFLSETLPDSSERALLAESVTLAMLVVMESLSPLERAVFVLREAFGFPYAEIGAMLDRSDEAVRQLAGRARRHVTQRKPRYDVDTAAQRDITERFLEAAAGGDMEGLMALLAPDVDVISDTGGKAKAPRRVVEGAENAARVFIGGADGNEKAAQPQLLFREINGQPGLLVLSDGELDTVMVPMFRDGRIARIYIIRNPEKLGGVRV